MRRDEDLYRKKIEEMVSVYKKVAGDCWSQQQALERVVNHPASSFFIQGHSAYNVLRKVVMGKDIPIQKESEKRMYEEIWSRVQKMSGTFQYGHLSLRELCDIVVNQPAPEFYMKANSFRHVLRRERERTLQKMKEKYG